MTLVSSSRSRLSQIHPLVYVVLSTIILKLPYFFKVDINWDEGTFILLGQSVLDGHLPYTDILDNKSPLLWFIFAALVWISGKSIIFLRFLGALYVAATVSISYLIAEKVWGRRIATIAAMLFMIILNVGPSGQAIMSEHLALLPLMISLWLLTNFQRSWHSLFLTGFCMGLATLVRLNLAYTVLFIGIFIFIESCQTLGFKVPAILLRCLSFSIGFFTVVFLITIPYIIQNQVEALYLGFIQAPLNYIVPKNFFLALLEKFIQFFILEVLGARISIAFTFIFIPLFILFVRQVCQLISEWSKFSKEEQSLSTLAIIYFLSIGFSIVSSGVFFSHYVIQMLPFITLIATPHVSEKLKYRGKVNSAIAFILVAVFTVHLLIQCSITISSCLNNGICTYGKSVDLATYLREANPEGKPVWLTRYHVAHWFTETNPIVADIVHPSNINREGLLQAWHGEDYSSVDTVRKIFAAQPFLIFIDDYSNYLTNPEAQNLLSQNLNQKYLFKERVQSLDVYQVK